MITILEVLGLIWLSTLGSVLSGYPNSIAGYGHGNSNKYLPAPPGQTPPCAKNGATFCESTKTYPREAIQQLLHKYGYTYSLFITSESGQEFMTKETPNYGYGYGPSSSGGYDAPSYQQNLHNNLSHTNGHYPASSYSNYNTEYVPASPGRVTSDPHLAAAVVPILHSIWWNHIDRNNRRAFPYLHEHLYYQQQHRIKKRQVAAENQLCQANSRFVTPEAAMNNQGDWMYVVNMPDNPRYAQQVRIETCAGRDTECNGVCQVPPGYRAICRQKYTQKRLVALDGSGSTLRNGVFWIPLCCVCEIQRS